MATAAGKAKNVFDLKLLIRIFSYARPYSSKFILSVLLAIVLAIAAPVRPLLINKTLSSLQSLDGTWGMGIADFLLTITWIQVGLLLVETSLRFLFTYLTAWLGHVVVRDIRIQVFGKILSLNLRQFDKTPIGTLTTRTINDIESVNDIFAEGLVPILADFLSILAILSAMFYTDWRLTLVCLMPFPLLLLATYLFKESVKRSFTQVRNAVAALNAFFQEHISGMQVIQAFTAESKEGRRFEKINRNHRDANIHAIFAYSVFFPVVEIVLAFSMGLLVWYAARNAYGLEVRDANGIAGNIVSFILLINLLFRPIRVMADKFNVLQMGMVAGERVFVVLDNPDYLSDQINARALPVEGKIAFNHVGFAYETGHPVLNDISFKVEKGETLAIVGHTGSGKSTIINLISRLYQHQTGDILVDDRRIEDFTIASLRSRIAVVLQDVFLFSGSIMENVTLRDPAIQEHEVIEAAQWIGIHDFIMQLPGGYQYQVMERGGTLSMGQRQLISFMRALLFKPAILILDEATSSVDSHTEQLIQHAIQVLTTGRTSIVIAHRLSTIQKAHQILLLDKGRVVEHGTHAQLLQQGGHYATLVGLQQRQMIP